MNYNKFIEKYHSSPNAIHHQILDEGIRSVAPSDELVGSAREEMPEESLKGMSSTHIFSHESVVVKSDTQNKVLMYRDIARYPEVSNVLDQITNDCIIYDQFGEAVYLNLDNVEWSDSIKKKVQKEFDNVKRMLNAKIDLPRHFRDWYIDSKIFFENVIDDELNKIVEMRRLDPVAVVPKILDITSTEEDGSKVYVGSKLYYEYNNNMSYMTDLQQGLNFGSNGMYNSTSRRVLDVNRITYAHSGIMDCKGFVKGHMHQAVKPAHTLKMIEDAIIIYRLTRSPDRKIYYIDTGDLPAEKAEEMMRNIMNRNTKKYTFDTATGKLNTDTGSPLMVDDYYIQRKNGLNVSDVDTLAGATGMNELDDLRWHNKKLYEALKVPLSRMPNENVVMFGDDGGTTRDEINFQKFIFSLRKSFSEVFLTPLRINLIMTNVVTEESWKENEQKIFIDYVESEYFKEKAKLELLRERADIAETYMGWVGKIVSYNYIAKKIFLMSDEEISEEKAQIIKESKDEILYPPEPEEDTPSSSGTTINYRSNAKQKDPESENKVTINKEE